MTTIVEMPMEELLNIFPSLAYYDINKDEIHIPSKDNMWNAVYTHEKIHSERRDKISLWITGMVPYWMMLIFVTVIGTVFIQWMAYCALIELLVWVYSYYHEESHIQKKLLRGYLIKGDKK